MLLDVARPHTVDGIDRAALELVEVARDDLRSLLDIWEYDGDLIFAGELSETLPDAVPRLEDAKRTVLAAELADDTIEVEDQEILVLQTLPSFEEEASCDEALLGCAGGQVDLRQSLLVELDLTPRDFHLLLIGDVVGASLFLDDLPLARGSRLLG